MGPVLTAQTVSSFVYFWSYDAFKSLALRLSARRHLSPGTNLVVAAVAGMM
jgi:hypothetical protein